MKKIILILSLLISNFSFSKDILTTRLMSTAGTGVGSILLHESNLLNPASAAFFNASSLYYQNYEGELENPNSNRAANSDNFRSPHKGDYYILTDTSSRLNGSLSYLSKDEKDFERKRISFSAAAPYTKNSAIGIIYRRTKDSYYNGQENKFHQAVLGLTHILSPRFSLGVVVVDPFKANPVDTKITLGVQYVVTDTLYLMADFGGNYNETISDTARTSFATQVKFLNSFFLRLGLYKDKALGIEGDGYGLSWIGPKLGLHFAILNSKTDGSVNSILYEGEKLTESSLAVSLKF